MDDTTLTGLPIGSTAVAVLAIGPSGPSGPAVLSQTRLARGRRNDVFEDVGGGLFFPRPSSTPSATAP